MKVWSLQKQKNFTDNGERLLEVTDEVTKRQKKEKNKPKKNKLVWEEKYLMELIF